MFPLVLLYHKSKKKNLNFFSGVGKRADREAIGEGGEEGIEGGMKK